MAVSPAARPDYAAQTRSVRCQLPGGRLRAARDPGPEALRLPRLGEGDARSRTSGPRALASRARRCSAGSGLPSTSQARSPTSTAPKLRGPGSRGSTRSSTTARRRGCFARVTSTRSGRRSSAPSAPSSSADEQRARVRRARRTALPARQVPGSVGVAGPWSYAAAIDGTFGNRYDDPDASYRVLYASSQRIGAFLETLARFRPGPRGTRRARPDRRRRRAAASSPANVAGRPPDRRGDRRGTLRRRRRLRLARHAPNGARRERDSPRPRRDRRGDDPAPTRRERSRSRSRATSTSRAPSPASRYRSRLGDDVSELGGLRVGS